MGPDGGYRIDEVPSGDYYLWVNANPIYYYGAAPYTKESATLVHVERGQITTIDFTIPDNTSAATANAPAGATTG